MLPVAHAPLHDFLTNYVRTGRNPANTCYAIALCFQMVAKEHASKVRLTDAFVPAAVLLTHGTKGMRICGCPTRGDLLYIVTSNATNGFSTRH
jgi:hypothetical protein